MGVIGVIVMYVGGGDVARGTMTLGSLVTFVIFIGMVTAPLISIASIGTQISEAFAGPTQIASSASDSQGPSRSASL